MHLVGLHTCYIFVPIVAATAWINFYGCNPLLHLSSQQIFCTVMVTYHSKVLQGIISYSSSYSYHGTCAVSIGRSTSTLRSARMPSHSMASRFGSLLSGHSTQGPYTVQCQIQCARQDRAGDLWCDRIGRCCFAPFSVTLGDWRPLVSQSQPKLERPTACTTMSI